jgi:L-Ala-D/L-Glu epimerase
MGTPIERLRVFCHPDLEIPANVYQFSSSLSAAGRPNRPNPFSFDGNFFRHASSKNGSHQISCCFLLLFHRKPKAIAFVSRCVDDASAERVRLWLAVKQLQFAQCEVRQSLGEPGSRHGQETKWRPLMRIREIVAHHVCIPLRKPVRHASHARTDTDSLVVRCTLDDGTFGWGEGLPREYVTGETIDAAWDVLQSSDLPRQLGGSCSGLGEVIETLDRFQVTRPTRDDRDCFGNSVRCAIELSILDAVFRREGMSLSALTALLPETMAIRTTLDQARYGAAFTAMSLFSQVRRACILRYYGFQSAKVKTGVEGVNDVALLRRMRFLLGRRFDLRIDANEAWTCANLEAKVTPLLPFGITSVEQPVPHEEVDGLAKLRGKIGVPLMLDESLCSLVDARRAIECGTCDLFNIRLSKCGGFLNSLRLAALAHQAGLGYQLGCQVGETGILSAAGRHFATSVANIRYLEGSYDRFLVRERLTVEDITFGRGGFAPALPGPGLGITVDEAAVARVTQRTATFAF